MNKQEFEKKLKIFILAEYDIYQQLTNRINQTKNETEKLYWQKELIDSVIKYKIK
jgi:hypothetical protein